MAQATYNEERTPQLSMLAAAQSVGIIFGPLIQSALTAVGCEDHTGEDRYFTIDTYTLARCVRKSKKLSRFIILQMIVVAGPVLFSVF